MKFTKLVKAEVNVNGKQALDKLDKCKDWLYIGVYSKDEKLDIDKLNKVCELINQLYTILLPE